MEAPYSMTGGGGGSGSGGGGAAAAAFLAENAPSAGVRGSGKSYKLKRAVGKLRAVSALRSSMRPPLPRQRTAAGRLARASTTELMDDALLGFDDDF
jgi:hypothetical protein